MTPQAPQIPADVRERIIAAATDLFEQSGRETMPTVDAVRRAARVDMNAASAVMKEWRRAQTAQAAPVAVAVPEVVQQASSAAVATIWQQAQELANESLRSAQAAWETERAELDAMRQELAEAFERRAGELDATTAELAAEKAATEKLAQELAAVRQELGAAQEQAHTAEARAQEIERRADELRTELDRAHQDADQARGALAEQQKASRAAAAQLDQVRAELVKVQAKAEANEEAHQEQRKTAAGEAHRMAERLTAARAERDQPRRRLHRHAKKPLARPGSSTRSRSNRPRCWPASHRRRPRRSPRPEEAVRRVTGPCGGDFTNSGGGPDIDT